MEKSAAASKRAPLGTLGREAVTKFSTTSESLNPKTGWGTGVNVIFTHRIGAGDVTPKNVKSGFPGWVMVNVSPVDSVMMMSAPIPLRPDRSAPHANTGEAKLTSVFEGPLLLSFRYGPDEL